MAISPTLKDHGIREVVKKEAAKIFVVEYDGRTDPKLAINQLNGLERRVRVEVHEAVGYISDLKGLIIRESGINQRIDWRERIKGYLDRAYCYIRYLLRE